MICMSLAEISSETANGFLTSQLDPQNVPAFTIPNCCSDGLTQDRQAVLLPMKLFYPDVCPSVQFLNITWENHPNHCQ